MDAIEYLDRLGHIDPADPGVIEAAATAVREAATREAGSPGLAPIRRRSLLHPSRKAIAMALIPACAALAAAGWAISQRSSSQVTGGIACYATASVNASATIVAASGNPPTAVCAGLWAQGQVGPGTTAVPALVACVLPRGGAIGVFPDTTCAALDLQPLPPHYVKSAARFAALRDSLRDRFAQSSCISEAAGRTLTQEALQTFGFADWQIAVDHFSPETACATFSPDTEHHRIILSGGLPPQFNNAMNAVIESQRATCAVGSSPHSADAAIQAFTQALHAAGYSNWTVKVGQIATQDQPCYDPAIDLTHHVITLLTMAMSTK